MPDVETPEAPAVTEAAPAEPEAVAEPVEPASPEAADSDESGAGAAEPADEGPSLADALKDLTAEQLDAVMASLPEETREASTFLQQERRSAEDRARVRRTEEETARQTTRTWMDEAETVGQQAEQWLSDQLEEPQLMLRKLQKMAADPDYLDAKEVATSIESLSTMLKLNVQSATEPIRVAERAKVARRQAQEITDGIREHADVIGKLSDDEYQQLSTATHQDGTRGGASAAVLWQKILTDRYYQKGLREGVEKGLKDKQAQAAILDKVKNIQSMKNGIAPAVNGDGTSAFNRSHEATVSRIAAGKHDAADEAYWAKWIASQ